MTRALQGEFLKLRTTRTFLALTASAVGLSALAVVLFASLSENLDRDDVHALFTADFTGLFILLLGAIGMSGEFRHRTIASTVLSTPNRLTLMLAKLLAYAAAGVVLSLVVNVAIMSVGTLILSARDELTLSFGDLLDILWRNLVIAAFWGALGVCVGTLIRNQAGAIVTLLAWLFVVEPTVSAVAFDVWRWSPFGGAPAAITGIGPEGTPDPDLFSLGLGLILEFGWLALFAGAALAYIRRRDLL
jgi:ABC-type transport system involved in multi-copper enzyme maturation permease subunit